MMMSEEDKRALKSMLVQCLRREKEITKIIVFGSFLTSDDPHDIDVAVFQDSAEEYLPLALKYRRRTRPISRRLPIDIIPLSTRVSRAPFLAEIARGEVLYER